MGGSGSTVARGFGPEVELMEAVTNGEVEVIERLLAAGVPIDITDDESSTPLHVAVYTGQVQVV